MATFIISPTRTPRKIELPDTPEDLGANEIYDVLADQNVNVADLTEDDLHPFIGWLHRWPGRLLATLTRMHARRTTPKPQRRSTRNTRRTPRRRTGGRRPVKSVNYAAAVVLRDQMIERDETEDEDTILIQRGAFVEVA